MLKHFGLDTMLDYMHCDLHLRDVTSAQGQDTPFRCQMQLCKILRSKWAENIYQAWNGTFSFKSNSLVNNYDKGFDNIYSVLKDMTSDQGHETPHHRNPCFGVYPSQLPMASFKKFFSFLIINSKKGTCLNYCICRNIRCVVISAIYAVTL